METTARPPDGARRVEWAAAAIVTLATLFFWWRGFTTLFAALVFPGLIALRWLGVVPPVVTFASADVLFGGLLYALGLMELVELATLRTLDDR